jgi:uncharacterized membrane protein YeaQ/YmgE (transglycosylase-associated protein family)
MGIIGWIILGGIAGWIASMITGRDASMGIGANIVVGIVGALLGGFVFSLIGGEDVTGFNLWSLFVAVIGSVILLGLIGLFRKPSV